jgi:hypothetical protein
MFSEAYVSTIRVASLAIIGTVPEADLVRDYQTSIKDHLS